jgi:hypothetical protein
MPARVGTCVESTSEEAARPTRSFDGRFWREGIYIGLLGKYEGGSRWGR